jgi:hypothetical protein
MTRTLKKGPVNWGSHLTGSKTCLIKPLLAPVSTGAGLQTLPPRYFSTNSYPPSKKSVHLWQEFFAMVRVAVGFVCLPGSSLFLNGSRLPGMQENVKDKHNHHLLLLLQQQVLEVETKISKG